MLNKNNVQLFKDLKQKNITQCKMKIKRCKVQI